MVSNLLRVAALAAAALTGLAGCGGGLYVGFDLGGDGDAPSVSLAAPSSVRAGELLRLVAAASDRDGIDDVQFFLVDAAGGRTLLGSDAQAPYEWAYLVPAGSGGTLRVQARARDGSGDRADSAVVSVSVLP